MKKFLPYILIVIILAGVFTPAVTLLAANSQITTYQFLAPLPNPDGGPSASFDLTQTNSLCAYINLMIKIFIGICSVLAMIMIVMGGIEYMTSELPGNKSHGKDRINNAIFGLILALAAWTILYQINPTILATCLPSLVNQSVNTSATTTENPPTPRPTPTPIPPAPPITPTPPGNQPGTCTYYADNGVTVEETDANSTGPECDSNGGTFKASGTPPAASMGTCKPITNPSNLCNVDNMRRNGFSDSGPETAAQASYICNAESGGRASLQSSADGVDKCSDGTSFSYGLFQINIIANGDMVPGGICSNLFTVNPNPPGKVRNSRNDKELGGCLAVDKKTGYCTSNACSVANKTKLQTCINYLSNPANNIAVAAKKADQEGWRHWTTDKDCPF